MVWQIHTSFHTGRGAVSGSNGFAAHLEYSIIANLIYTEKSFYINFQSSSISLPCNKKPSGNSSSTKPIYQYNVLVLLGLQIQHLSLSTYKSLCLYCMCMHDIVKMLRILLALSRSAFKIVNPAVSHLFNSKILPSVHPSLSTLSSLRLPLFYFSQIIPSPLSLSSIFSCLLMLTQYTSTLHPGWFLNTNPFLQFTLLSTCTLASPPLCPWNPFTHSAFLQPPILSAMNRRRPNGIMLGLICFGVTES